MFYRTHASVDRNNEEVTFGWDIVGYTEGHLSIPD